MKAVALFVVILTLCGLTAGADMVLEESFRNAFPPAGWTVVQTSTDQTWQKYAYYGMDDYACAVVYGEAYGNVQDEFLHTGAIDLAGYTHAEVTFWNVGFTAGYPDGSGVTLEVSTDAAKETWTPIWNFPGIQFITFQKNKVDLSSYAGQQIFLGWRAVSDGSATPFAPAYYLDDIKVRGYGDFCYIGWKDGGTDSPILFHRGGGGAWDGKIYTWGGIDDNFMVIGAAQVYDPGTDTWSGRAAMTEPRADFGSAILNGKGYAVAGNDETFNVVDTVYEYDIVGNAWSALAADYPLEVAGVACAAGADGKLYCFGGLDGTPTPHAEAYVYDPASKSSWTALASMPGPKHYAVAAAAGDSIYVAGGWDDGNGADSAFYKYDASSNSWETLDPLAVPRQRPMMTEAFGNLWVTGGATYWVPVPGADAVYDATNDQWFSDIDTGMESPRIAGVHAFLPEYGIFAMGGSAHVVNPTGSNQRWDLCIPGLASVAPATGEPGATVTFTGTNFMDGVKAYLYNDAKLEAVFENIQPVNAGSFSAEVPNVPGGTYGIRIVNNFGQTTETIDAFEVPDEGDDDDDDDDDDNDDDGDDDDDDNDDDAAPTGGSDEDDDDKGCCG